MTTAVRDLRATPQQSLARENHDEQRMNAFPKKERQLDKKCKIPVGRTDLPPVFPERQSAVVPANRQLPGIVVPLPQVLTGGLVAELIS